MSRQQLGESLPHVSEPDCALEYAAGLKPFNPPRTISYYPPNGEGEKDHYANSSDYWRKRLVTSANGS
jgi:hypothetical protein